MCWNVTFLENLLWSTFFRFKQLNYYVTGSDEIVEPGQK